MGGQTDENGGDVKQAEDGSVIHNAEACAFKLARRVLEHHQMFASFDGGISWKFIGYLNPEKQFAGLPQFNSLDADDQAAVIAGVNELWPNVKHDIVKPLPPGVST